MDVLLVAARRESVAALAAVIADAGHTATVVDVGALALRNAYTANRVGWPGRDRGAARRRCERNNRHDRGGS